MAKVIVATSGTSGVPEFAGSTWVRLQYVLGLQRLGIESFWVDRLGPIDPFRGPHSLDHLMDRFEALAGEFGFDERYCVIYNGGERYFGMSEREFDHLTAEAVLLINISGALQPSMTLMRIPRRAYIDVDPGFTQIWAHQSDLALESYNAYFTVGQNVGYPEFRIPTLGIQWHPTLPPIALDQWPVRIDERSQRFSTVADWRGSQDAIFQEQYYGGKRDEFVRFLHVPMRSGERIELALCIGQQDYEDLGLLDGHNWVIQDPYLYAGNVHSYREFIQYSRAEFSVAKKGYVLSTSGWISDRTACYLASGKPAIVQSTGFEGKLLVGEGLLTFKTVDEAIAAIEEVNRNYLHHCQAARRIAEEHFNSDIVLGKLLERVGL